MSLPTDANPTLYRGGGWEVGSRPEMCPASTYSSMFPEEWSEPQPRVRENLIANEAPDSLGLLGCRRCRCKGATRRGIPREGGGGGRLCHRRRMPQIESVAIPRTGSGPADDASVKCRAARTQAPTTAIPVQQECLWLCAGQSLKVVLDDVRSL